MFRNGLEPWHVIVLLVIFVLVFGTKRLPELAKSVGQSLRLFKSEVKDLTGDSWSTSAPSPHAPAPEPALPEPAPNAGAASPGTAGPQA